jgi:F-type H+-transporting ATPase subunit b
MADISTSANAAVEGHEAASAGLPQLDFSLWPGEMIWALAIFAVLYFVLATLFLPRLRHAIHQRASAISEALADARALRDEAEAQAKAAQAEIAEARARAQKLAADAKAKAKAQAAAREAEAEKRLVQRLAEADARIRASRDQAMTHVRGIAEETAAALVTKLTGETPAAQEVTGALEDASV